MYLFRLALLLTCVAPVTVVHSEDVEAVTVVDGLKNPCGVAIQPDTGTVFVADSGNGKIVRIVDGKAEDVVIGFPLDEYGKGPKYAIGPLGLAFLDKETLIVGGGGQPDEQELLRVYEVPVPGAAAISADNLKTSFRLEAKDDQIAEGNFFGVVVGAEGIYVTCNGDDAKGWVAKADLKEKEVTNFRRFVPTKELTQVNAPVAITTNSRGDLVVGQMGAVDQKGDGVLGIYNAKNGRRLSRYDTELSDLCGLAFSPKTGLLYGTDFAWSSHDASSGVNSEAGLFRLDDDRTSMEPRVQSTRILQLDKPTALAFAEDGTLYVTVFGGTKDGQSTGRLIKIAPGL